MFIPKKGGNKSKWSWHYSLQVLLLKKSNFVFYYIPWMPVHFQYLLQPFIQLHIQRCTEKFSLRTQFWIPNFNVNRIFCFLFSLSTLNSVLWEQSKFSSLKTKYMTQYTVPLEVVVFSTRQERQLDD